MCDNTGCNNNSNLSKCGSCLDKFYCSKECQASAWTSKHKSECKVLVALKNVTDKQCNMIQVF